MDHVTLSKLLIRCRIKLSQSAMSLIVKVDSNVKYYQLSMLCWSTWNTYCKFSWQVAPADILNTGLSRVRRVRFLDMHPYIRRYFSHSSVRSPCCRCTKKSLKQEESVCTHFDDQLVKELEFVDMCLIRHARYRGGMNFSICGLDLLMAY